MILDGGLPSVMYVKNVALLEKIFALQGNFAEGVTPLRRQLAGGIEVAAFKNNAAAACCISADFEMGWGWRSRGPAGADSMGLDERRNFPVILSLLDQFSIPITWATVGHLFLESCTRSCDGLAHPEMPRPVSDGTWSGDWYWPDPCSNVREAPAWYGPDLIQQIVDSPIPHEIGTHSFSHINFQAAYSSAVVVERELAACIEAMKPFGVSPKTLIFPRHQAEFSYLPIYAAAGVTALRHRDSKNGVRLSYPERLSSGIYRIYESMNLRIARRYDYLEKVKIFTRRAMERNAVYSLWFHPSDPTKWFDPQLRAILGYLDGERQQGQLWIATMHELAAYCEARERVKIGVEHGRDSLTLTIDSSLDVSRYGTPEITLLVPVHSRPAAAWQRLNDGTKKSIDIAMATGGPTRAIATVPATATTLQFTF